MSGNSRSSKGWKGTFDPGNIQCEAWRQDTGGVVRAAVSGSVCWGSVARGQGRGIILRKIIISKHKILKPLMLHLLPSSSLFWPPLSEISFLWLTSFICYLSSVRIIEKKWMKLLFFIVFAQTNDSSASNDSFPNLSHIKNRQVDLMLSLS